MAEKFDIYQTITDKILTAMEAGIVPWQKPWAGRNESMPRNGSSNRLYTGINAFLLSLMGYSDPRFYTFKEVGKHEGTVKKGEHGNMVVFWKVFLNTDPDTGKEKKAFMLRYYRVFNVDQTEGMKIKPLKSVDVDAQEWDAVAEAERIIAEMPNAPKITYVAGDSAHYVPSRDIVTFPLREQFAKPELFYATAFHELGHSTGHESRLNRPEVVKGDGFGTGTYGREELVAEMTSAFVCAMAGIDNTVEHSAAYLDNWTKAIKGDKKLVITAASKAQKAAAYIIGTTAPVAEAEEE